MKIFDLVCANDHRFEGWFSSAEDFERQRDAAVISCPVCGDTHVVKVPSAAYVNTGHSDRAPAKAQGAARQGAGGEADPRRAQYANLRSALLAKVVEYVVKNTEDVGPAFPEEARKIHYGEAPERKIRGTASQREVAAMRDEGIDVVPLPVSVPAGKTH